VNQHAVSYSLPTLDRQIRQYATFPGIHQAIKTFFSGQKLDKKHELAVQNLDPEAPWHKRMLIQHRRLIAVLIPNIFFRYIPNLGSRGQTRSLRPYF